MPCIIRCTIKSNYSLCQQTALNIAVIRRENILALFRHIVKRKIVPARLNIAFLKSFPT